MASLGDVHEMTASVSKTTIQPCSEAVAHSLPDGDQAVAK